ncbi:MAG: HigA family addiction module antidote protein [Bacilli bacterium]|nr:HigA family addiction module antidote protein [Bacilli bacterium]
MAQNKYGLSRDFIIHPGETIAEFLTDRNMSQKELAIRCGVSEKHVSTVISGQKNISANFAKKLEYALEIDAIFWMNLQTNYDKEILEFEEINEITDEEINILNKLKHILKEYKRLGLLEDGLTQIDELIEIRKIFKISNLLDIPKIQHLGAYRLSKNNTVDDYVLFAWERLCELIDADNPNDIEFDVEMLKKVLPEIKKIMFEDIKSIVPKLRDVFSKCGINFYLAKSYVGAPVQGYIRRNNHKGLSLYMTIRGSYADIFWFTLFHEIAHILNGDIKKCFIDYNETTDEVEKRANKCAAEYLIPSDKYQEFINKQDFSLNSIFNFSKENNIKPYICIGRLMKENYVSWSSYSQYREKYNLI